MRITELPQAASVAQTDDLAIDVPGGRTYRVPRSILAPAPYIATIPTGQWSGSGTDRYITVTASNVTADAMLYPFYDNASAALLNGPVWVIPADGSFTIHTSAIPSGTVTISVLLAGIVGEAQYQVLSDVYSKSQVDTIVAQSTAITDVSSGITASSTYVDTTATVEKRAYRQGNVVMFHFTFKAAAQSASGQAIFTGLPKAYGNTMQFTAMNTTSHAPVEFAVTTSGTLAYWYSNTGFATGDQIRGSVTYICQ